MRINWDEYALSLAQVAKLRSEDFYRKVGACALDHENRVLGVAYNGLKSGKIVPDSFWSDREKRRPFMLHAEANLLSLFKKGDCKTIALTCSPCSACATLIAAHDIKRVIYCDEYELDKSGLDILNFYDIELIKIDSTQIKAIIQTI
jgi:dCMP deaminase